MSNPSNSYESDDFFWDNSDSPAKPSLALKQKPPTTTKTAATATATATATTNSTIRPPPPPPPGKKKESAEATSAAPALTSATATTTTTTARATKPVAKLRPASKRYDASGSKPSGATAATAGRPLPTAKTAPTMGRPVTSYYGQEKTTATKSSSSSTHLTASSTRPSSGFYSGNNTNTMPSASTSSSLDWTQPSTSGTTGATDWSNQNFGKSTTSSSSDWFSSTDSTAQNGYSNNGLADPMLQQQQKQQLQQGMNPSTMMNPYGANSQQQQQQPQLGNFNYPGSSVLQGSMDQNASSNGSLTSMMDPQQFSMNQQQQLQQSRIDDVDLSNEPPLLEELGINLEHILLKTKAVILPLARFGGDQLDPTVICKDADLAGPIAFCLLLGAEMVLTGKLQFGYIYGFGLFGCLSMTLVLNLMSPTDPISFWTVTSILGYSLLPVNLLALLKIFVMNLINLQTLGRILGLLTVAWSTTSATRLLELGCGLRDQRYLVAYPMALLYSAFVLITIF